MDIAQTITPGPKSRQLYLRNDQFRTEIYQDEQHTWLVINDVVQSAIENRPPYRPILPHSLVMLLPLIHDKAPNTVLELGGGGLSTQRYVRHAFPQAHFVSCELDENLTKAVRRCFPGSQDLNVVNRDAHLLVAELVAQKSVFDWILIDLYDGENCAIQNRLELLRNCQKLLSDQGWLIFNHLSSDPDTLLKLSSELLNLFGKAPYQFQVPDMQNHIFMIRTGKQQFAFPSAVEQNNANLVVD